MSALKIVSAALAALILITSAGCASTKEHESTGQYFDDSVITAKVKSAIMADDSLKVSEVNVETFKGVVQLSGFVNSSADIGKAVQIARAVDGVTDVKNAMQLKN